MAAKQRGSSLGTKLPNLPEHVRDSLARLRDADGEVIDDGIVLAINHEANAYLVAYLVAVGGDHGAARRRLIPRRRPPGPSRS